jgi:hypothetical protein
MILGTEELGPNERSGAPAVGGSERFAAIAHNPRRE